MSGPTRQRSLKDRLKDGIGFSWQRRRSSQGSSATKSNKPYVIPTGAKSRSMDSHGYINPLEWDNAGSSCKKTNNEMIKKTLHKPLTKSTSEPSHDSETAQIQEEKEKKQVTRTMTQPSGTIAFTVQPSDTLTSIAARFDTTPSELVKLNRLVSRLIFPGQVLYVPDKLSKAETELTNEETSPGETVVKKLELASPNAGPKPGHVECVQTPDQPAPRTLSEEEERCLDQECIEKFLKINVRHITDGQGVAAGVLLVTPNAVMFDPNVSDPLAIEHGAEKYSVIAPMNYVVNAAMYSDIATMYVSHAPHRATLPQPEVYHIEDKNKTQETNQTTLPTKAGHPSHSDSELVVNCGVAKEAVEDDRLSVSLNQIESGVQATASSQLQDTEDNSEVFLNEESSSSVNDKINNKHLVDIVCSRNQKDSSVSVENEDSPEIPKSANSQESLEETLKRLQAYSSTDSNKTTDDNKLIEIKKSYTEVPNTTEDYCSKKEESADVENKVVPLKSSNTVLQNTEMTSRQLLLSLTEGVVTTSGQPSQSETAATAPAGQNQPRKHSSSDCQGTTESRKMKVLKRLSYPLTWMESFSGSDKDKENMPPTLDDAQGTSSAPLSNVATPVVSTNDNQEQTQSTFSKILGASPRNLVDFSSGLFTKSSDEAVASSKVESSAEGKTVPNVASDPSSHVHDVPIQMGNSVFYQPHTKVSDKNQDSNIYNQKSVYSVSSASADKELKVGFKSVVSVDDMPDLFASIDQTVLQNFEEFELIPRPAKPCDDPPLYLCLRMGKQLNSKIPKTTPVFAYGKRCLRREYWFSIPRDRVNELYNFFEHWAPSVYGEFNEELIHSRGFQLITSDEEKSDEESTDEPDIFDTSSQLLKGNRTSDTQSDWEVVSMSDCQKQMNFEVELPLPDLIGKTEILEDEHRKLIAKHLPARAEGYAWTLIFSTSQHGFSLKSLYRKMAKYETPVLLVIMDTESNVFGSLTSCSLKVSDHFYGTGESFLFTFYPEFKVYGWTGENMYFIKGNAESLAIGAGDGLFGLWLDGDLYHGRSHPCKTYFNETLSAKEDFCVTTLEAWGFIEVDTTVS